MLKIRMKRLGRTKRPFYRIVVINGHARRQGHEIEKLGFFNPLSRELKLDKSKAEEWLKKGAQPSERVQYLINNAPETGELVILEKVKREKLNKKAKARVEAEKQAAAAAEAAKAEAAAAAAQAAEAPAQEAPAEEAPAEAEQAAAE